jgi:UDPglucose--hexose-1-phosphate uridylyltransferase
MSVIRLRGADRNRIAEAAEMILKKWRAYDDDAAFIFHETDGEAHNTITPIARRRGSDYELDLVLRNNITTAENPLGVYHPHADKHHIKKENIGLIEVMGLAVLPARLKGELAAVGEALVSGRDLSADPATASHEAWAKDILQRYPDLNKDNVSEIIEKETGLVFAAVLEDAGVYKKDEEGRKAFDRFIASL